jgi:hypothetical protein
MGPGPCKQLALRADSASSLRRLRRKRRAFDAVEATTGNLLLPYDLTKLPQHIEEMRQRLSQTAAGEHTLVKDLSDSLHALDQQLLQAVRQVAADHQIRRGTILNELQSLADSIGMFQSPHGVTHRVAAPDHAAAAGQIGVANQGATARGDWRATENLNIEDDLAKLELYMTGRDPRH